MNLAVTPAIKLTEEQKAVLSDKHTLFFIDDERVPLTQQKINFDPAVIEGIICNFFFVNNDLSALPSLRTVQLTSVGSDRVPLEEISKKGIKLYNAGSAYAVPMAEWAVAKILEIVKCANFFRKNQTAHHWEKCRDIRELGSMTAAIVGFGNVGQAVAERLKPFGVKIRAVDVAEIKSLLADDIFFSKDLGTALDGADIVVLCLPFTDKTHHIMDKKMMSKMKDDAVLVNIARGGLIDTEALLNELKKGRFSGVALDVFENEPLDTNSMLWDCDRVLISPHNSFVGNGNNARLFEVICNNLMK